MVVGWLQQPGALAAFVLGLISLAVLAFALIRAAFQDEEHAPRHMDPAPAVKPGTDPAADDLDAWIAGVSGVRAQARTETFYMRPDWRDLLPQAPPVPVERDSERLSG